MDPLKVSEFIKKIRKDNKLTQKKLAEKYNVTYQAVSKWETGRNLPDVSILKQMSEDYNVSIDDILDGKTGHGKLKIFFKILLALVALAIIAFIVQITIYINESFKFKTITSSCDTFEVSGTIAYNKKKSAIHISNVEYCGGDDETKYTKIESVLYERQKADLVEIKDSKRTKKNLTLEAFLKDLEIKIDDYATTCKNNRPNSIILEINATDNSNRVVTYKIPLEIKDKCEN